MSDEYETNPEVVRLIAEETVFDDMSTATIPTFWLLRQVDHDTSEPGQPEYYEPRPEPQYWNEGWGYFSSKQYATIYTDEQKATAIVNDDREWVHYTPRYLTATLQPAVFVNVWDAGRAYGGPEEGGWWYDVGECIQSAICTEDEAEDVRERLQEQYPRTGRRNSVLGGEDYNVTIDREPGTFDPEERPHYE